MTTRNSPVRIGVIGCGQIAQTHFANYADIPDATVVACADIDHAAADKSAKKFDIPNVYYDAHEMLKRDDLDAIDVCMHNNLHMPGTVAALESGRPVYCEKPMAGSYRDALTMIETAKARNLMLHIQLAFIYSDEVRAARELVKAGELGHIYHARSTGFRRRGRPFVDGYGKMPFVQKHMAAGGALFDMGVYHISELLFLLDNPRVERVTGQTYQELEMDAGRREAAGYSVEELGTGFVHFEGGLTLDIIEAWAAHHSGTEESCLLGSHGGIRIRPFTYYRTVADIDISAGSDLGAQHYRWGKLRPDAASYSSSQQHWVDALLGRVPLLPTAEIALNTMLISEAIYLSSAERREVTPDDVISSSKSLARPF